LAAYFIGRFSCFTVGWLVGVFVGVVVGNFVQKQEFAYTTSAISPLLVPQLSTNHTPKLLSHTGFQQKKMI
jgi:uncharacterized protein YqgC (DUF456 family)